MSPGLLGQRPDPGRRTGTYVALLLAIVIALSGTAVASGGAPIADAAPSSPVGDPVSPSTSYGAAADNASTNASENARQDGIPRLVAIAPNPTADGDAGEYVSIRFPASSDPDDWRLVDDEGTTARLPAAGVDRTAAFSPQPAVATPPNGTPVRRLRGSLDLANGGEALTLRRANGTVVDSVTYDSAPEGERYRRTDSGWAWRPRGATSLSPVRTEPAAATAFVLPDADGQVPSTLSSADERLLLAGYTLTSERVVRELIAAHRRDVEVAVLLEGSPVGGISRPQADAIDRLVAAGVDVRLLDGEQDPYRFHHAKYAVVDDRALVLTENFKPAGTGGHSSRGWGAVVRDPVLADELAALFGTDRDGPAAVTWERIRERVDPVAGGAASERYPDRYGPASLPVESARLLVAPDNARRELGELIRSANTSVRVQQLSIEGIDDPLLQASIAAARNGTEVEVLLSGASYVQRENGRLVDRLDRVAAREGLPIEASVVDPRGRFSKVHAKGVIVDERHVAIGSLNWNPTAYGENREVVVVLTGEAIAGYYVDVFEADQRRAALWRVPVGLVAAVLLAWLLVAGVGLVRIRWAPR